MKETFGSFLGAGASPVGAEGAARLFGAEAGVGCGLAPAAGVVFAMGCGLASVAGVVLAAGCGLDAVAGLGMLFPSSSEEGSEKGTAHWMRQSSTCRRLLRLLR